MIKKFTILNDEDRDPTLECELKQRSGSYGGGVSIQVNGHDIVSIICTGEGVRIFNYIQGRPSALRALGFELDSSGRVIVDEQ